MQRILIILTTISVLAGTTVLLWPTSFGPILTTVPNSQDEIVAPTDRLQGSVPGPTEPSRQESPGGDERPDRREVEGTTAKLAGLTVWFHYDHENGEPAGGVEVFFGDLRELFREGGPGHWSEKLERRGKTHRADASGRLQLPAVKEALVVGARSKGRYGAALIRRDMTEQHIALVLDQTLHIRVLDDQGEPAPLVPVAIAQRFDEKRWQRRLRLETDDAGSATEPHFQLVRERPPRGGTEDYSAAVPVPFQQPVVTTFRNDPLPNEPIELRLPPTGSLIIRVVDSEGTAVSSAARITATVPRKGPPHPSLAPNFDRLVRRKEQGETSVSFPWLGLGLDLRLHIRFDDDDFTWEVSAKGPVASGETLTIDVPTPTWMGLLRGRLLDPAGRPHADENATFLITDRSGRIEGEEISTDASGQFVLPFRVRRTQPPIALEIRAQYADAPAGVVHAVRALDAGSTNLGDLHLEGLDLLATGTVTNDLGHPLEGARVTLQRERLRRGADPTKLAWQDEAFVETKTGPDGTFVLFGQVPPGSARLHASAQNHTDASSAAFAPGSELSLQLTRTGRLNGRLRAPSWLPAAALDLRLRPQGSGRARNVRPRGRADRLRYDFRQLIPGSYDFEVRVRNFPDPVLQVTNIRIEPGSPAADPRLTDIDLTTLLYRYEIEARDGLGNPVARLGSPLVAEIARLDGRVEHRAFPWRNGRVEIFSTTPTLQVVQLGTGYRPQQATVSSGRQTLIFERLSPPTVVLPNIRQLCGDRRVRISLVLQSTTGLPEGMRALDQRTGRSRNYSRAQLSKSGGAWLGTSDEVEVPLMRDGRYRVVVRLYEKGVRGPVSVIAGSVDVRLTGSRSQRLQATLDSNRIQAAIIELKKRRKKS
ncbi:MAG: carboxypeptidase regulatory-like domain-containing protein [bacterium]|nr:carboxypeptidase regulatory-like domain-containing protein [bacterium]